MPVLWSSDFSVGFPTIDAQHRELIVRINALSDACERGKGRAEIGATVAFLEEYVNSHFAAEERMMLATRYEANDEHQRKHAQFRRNLEIIKKQLAEEGPGIHIIIQTNHMIVDWIMTHIHTYDRKFGDFLQKQDASRLPQ